MSDAGNGEFANFDSRMLLYVPGWARRLAIGVLLLLVALSTALCAYAVFGKRQLGIEVLLVGLSILQTSAAGIAFVVVLFYSRRDSTMGTLVEQSDEFLRNHMRNALQKVSVPSLGIERCKVLDGGSKDVFGHLQTEPDLLTNPLQKLFWSQDVAMMTESFIRTALRNGLNLTTRCRPAPL